MNKVVRSFLLASVGAILLLGCSEYNEVNRSYSCSETQMDALIFDSALAGTTSICGELNGVLGATDRHGNENGAMSFSGGSDINFGSVSDFNLTQSMTVATWIYLEGDQVENNIIWNNEGLYEMALLEGGQIWYAVASPDPVWIRTFTGVYIAPEEWHHVAFQYDNGTIRIYVDGTKEYEYEGQGPLTRRPGDFSEFRIGGREFSPDQHFNGRIDDFHLYDIVISEAEIASLAGL